jgi:outer membrane protein
MFTGTKKIITVVLAMMSMALSLSAQEGAWTLGACINHALEKNITVQKANVTTQKSESYLEQSKALRTPSLSASARQNLAWNKEAPSYSSYGRSENTSLGVSSSVDIYKGGKINAQIKQSSLELNSAMLNAETIKESVSLNVVKLYLTVLYAKEQLLIAQQQVEASQKQLQLSEERLRLGDASKSDYLQIKSSLADDKLNLANAESSLAMAKVDLMQMMELPVDASFDVSDPALQTAIDKQLKPDAMAVYAEALAAKPQVKKAQFDTQSAELDKTIAKANYYPSLSLDGAVGTSYASAMNDYTFSQQMDNQLSPSLGLTLSIPIYQKKQAKTSVTIAKLAYTEAQLSETDTRNQLRKEVEQSCMDVATGQIEFRAGIEKLDANQEAYNVSEEKFKIGMMSVVDFIFQKNNLIEAQVAMLKAKYNLMFSYKILDFYRGLPLN